MFSNDKCLYGQFNYENTVLYSSNLKGLFWNDTNLYMILLLSIRLLEMICFLGEPWKKETETRMQD